MSRNKKIIQLIARLATAIFLFVLISPVTVYAQDSASDNDTDEEYQDWSDAFNDSDYTENLAKNIASTWSNYFVSYVGTREDVIDEVAEYIGENYDRTISLYDNLYTYILPYSRQTVMDIDGANLSIGTYGKPIRNKNNLKLINQYVKTMENSLPTEITSIATKKNKSGDSVTPDVFPSWFHIAMKYPANNLPFYPSDWNSQDLPCVLYVNPNAPDWYSRYDLWYPLPDSYTYNICFIKDTETNYYAGYGCSYYNSQGIQVNSHSYILYVRDGNWIKQQNWITYEMGRPSNRYAGDVYYYGSGYIQFQNRSQTRSYYWDNDTRTLYFLGGGNASLYFGTTDSDDVIGNYTVNIINSVDFGEYTDLINQLILDVNMENNITNSLLIELLNELRNQRDVYQPTSDDDDIYNYIDYMMQKLLEVKDIHIEIPDITPDLGGIAEALTALLNFLASIIRTLGNIVTTLLDGLFHLFIPTDDEWDDIALDFEPLIRPFSWIKGFFVEGTSAISTCLFGYNVLDFDSAETEDVELVSAFGSGSTSDGDTVLQIMYNENGAPKIPVHFSNSSSEIFSNIEDAYIIDLSWYTPFKPVGDIIVCAFCWIWFIWRVLHDLPGIISGATGIFDNDTFASVDNDADVFDHDLDKGIAFQKIFGNRRTSFRNSNAVTRNASRYQNRKMR